MTRSRTLLEALCSLLYGNVQAAAPHVGIATSTIYAAARGHHVGEHAQRVLEQHFKRRLHELQMPVSHKAILNALNAERQKSSRGVVAA